MRLGAVLPTYEIPADPIAIAEFAQATEQLGYTHLSVMDHVAGADLARSAADRDRSCGRDRWQDA